MDPRLLAKSKKTQNAVDFENGMFKIEFYENPDWQFTVSSLYVEAVRSGGLFNEKGTLKSNFSVKEPTKQRELERLRGFVGQKGIPMIEFYFNRKKLEEPRILTGSERRKEITNILNRFDQACYKRLAKHAGRGQ